MSTIRRRVSEGYPFDTDLTSIAILVPITVEAPQRKLRWLKYLASGHY